MARPFRPLAKIPVKISFISYERPKKVVWERGFVKIVDNGECVELSSYYKDHANLPIERLYKNKLRGNDVQPYIFSIRLDANHPENEGQKLIRLNFNGNREGYEHALNSINNAFEAFSYRFNKQAKKRPRPENEEKTVRKNKKKGHLNTEKKKEQEKPLKIDKAANFTESLPQPSSRSAVVSQLLRPPPPKLHSWASELDRLLGGPEKVSSPKVIDPQEEQRLAEIRRRNDLKHEQWRKERAERRKEKPAEKPIQEDEVHVLKEIKLSENNSIAKKLGDRGKTTREPLRTVLYGYGNAQNPLNTSSEREVVSLGPNQKSSVKIPVDVRKRLALRQGSVVRKPRNDSEQTNSSRKASNRSEESSSSKSSSEPAKRAHRESSSSSSQESVDEWPTRLRGFSPDVSPSPSPKKSSNSKPNKRGRPKRRLNVSPDVSPYPSPKKSSNSKPERPKRRLIVSPDSSPNVSPYPSPKKSTNSKSYKPEKPKRRLIISPDSSPNVSPYPSPKKSSNSKPQKPKRRLIISSESELSDDEPTNEYRDTPVAHEMDLNFEAPSPMDPPSGETSEETSEGASGETSGEISEETSGYSTGNQSSSTSVFGDSQPLQDVKVEPIDEDYDQSIIATQPMIDNQLEIPRLENIQRGQQYVGMTFTHTTITNSRLVNCDIQYSTIVNCAIDNSSISNSHVTSQTI